MFALLSPSLIALVGALAQGRSPSGLSRYPVIWWPLGLASFFAEFALSSTPLGQLPAMIAWGSAVWLLALAITLLMLVRNAHGHASAHRWAWGIAALGVLLNILVVAANDGHMPQSQAARIAAGASAEHVAGLASEPGWRNVAPMTDDTRLVWLGDVLPEPIWLPLHNVMSVGDLLLATGIAAVVYLGTTPRRLRAANVIA